MKKTIFTKDDAVKCVDVHECNFLLKLAQSNGYNVHEADYRGTVYKNFIFDGTEFVRVAGDLKFHTKFITTHDFLKFISGYEPGDMVICTSGYDSGKIVEVKQSFTSCDYDRCHSYIRVSADKDPKSKNWMVTDIKYCNEIQLHKSKQQIQFEKSTKRIIDNSIYGFISPFHFSPDTIFGISTNFNESFPSGCFAIKSKYIDIPSLSMPYSIDELVEEWKILTEKEERKVDQYVEVCMGNMKAEDFGLVHHSIGKLQ